MSGGMGVAQAQLARVYLPHVSADRVPFPAWGDREIRRFQFRAALFQRRGMTQPEAETWADRLFERDHERDDRRLCVECQNMRSATKCAKGQPVLVDVLQRCSQFTFETPNA
jgi:hypothetical protein